MKQLLFLFGVFAALCFTSCKKDRLSAIDSYDFSGTWETVTTYNGYTYFGESMPQRLGCKNPCWAMGLVGIDNSSVRVELIEGAFIVNGFYEAEFYFADKTLFSLSYSASHKVHIEYRKK